MWTYSGDPASSDNDAVRFLSRQTDENQQLVSDEEIAYALAQTGNAKLAAALVCDLLAAGSKGIKSKQVGDLKIEYDAGFYSNLAIQLRREAARGAVPFAGGISQSGKRAQEVSADRVKPAFTRDMLTVPGSEPSGAEE